VTLLFFLHKNLTSYKTGVNPTTILKYLRHQKPNKEDDENEREPTFDKTKYKKECKKDQDQEVEVEMNKWRTNFLLLWRWIIHNLTD